MKFEKSFLLTEKMTTDFLMEIVRTANLFSSYILVEVSGTQRNAKSLLSMSALKGFRGPVVVMVVGADSREALGTLSNNFIEMQKRTT